MSTNVLFLCGCRHEVDLKSEKNEVGMLVCPDHKVMRYGWRSVGRNHRLDRFTPVEIEQWEVFGEWPLRPDVEIGVSSVEDIRDNRDPATVEFEFISGVYARTEAPDPDHVEAVRRRLDLKDRTGWPVIQAPVNV